MLGSTSKFKVDRILFNKGGFAIAAGYWEGGDKPSLACRWHEPDGIGYPQTFGKPQWMILPATMVNIHDALDPANAKVELTFG
ncbi:hypothetical protein SAMN05216421_1124 [Halopseudomonas xinjiangensis]|uniref:Uncharacterized protein n=1 Tax=Halopseudomonas xinjiangensis TaxID=487184 RepID=A0A1H1QFR3_9GAMM|nr:hypothetical protein [Halopseudomonas xinjiangensis]SDS22137.1 hypothetical protein SAMN05216421_1124 [Halopseudomonas xinjiangensis]